MGQRAQITGSVHIVHLIPYGSVDASIAMAHGDKDRLIQLVQNDDGSGFGDDANATWKRVRRIVDNCALLKSNGCFPDMPTRVITEGGEMKAFSLLHNCPTRGVPPVPPSAVPDAPSSSGMSAAERSATAARSIAL